MTKFSSIKDYNKNAKLLLYAYPPIIESELETALHKETRKPLIKRIIEQLRSNNLDGIGLHSDFAFTNKNNKPIIMETFSQVRMLYSSSELTFSSIRINLKHFLT